MTQLTENTAQHFPLFTASASCDAVILADGDFPTRPLLLELLEKAPFVCCCDHAGKMLLERGRMPDVIVGDGDSLPDEFKERYAHIIRIVHEQDDNDLTKATRHCMSRGKYRILYLGATGKREDHSLGNISLMVRYASMFHVRPTLITNHGYFEVCEGMSTFESFPRQQVSIFNFGCTRLASRGLRWDAYPYEQLWQGTLNEAVGEEFSLYGNGTFMVYRTFEGK